MMKNGKLKLKTKNKWGKEGSKMKENRSKCYYLCVWMPVHIDRMWI